MSSEVINFLVTGCLHVFSGALRMPSLLLSMHVFHLSACIWVNLGWLSLIAPDRCFFMSASLLSDLLRHIIRFQCQQLSWIPTLFSWRGTPFKPATVHSSYRNGVGYAWETLKIPPLVNHWSTALRLSHFYFSFLLFQKHCYICILSLLSLNAYFIIALFWRYSNFEKGWTQTKILHK